MGLAWGAMCWHTWYQAIGSAVPTLATRPWDSLAPYSCQALVTLCCPALGGHCSCFFSAAALASVTSGSDGPTSWSCPTGSGTALCFGGPPSLLFRGSRHPFIPPCVAEHWLCTRACARRWGLAANRSDPGPCRWGAESWWTEAIQKSTNKAECRMPGCGTCCGGRRCPVPHGERGAQRLSFHEVTFEPVLNALKETCERHKGRDGEGVLHRGTSVCRCQQQGSGGGVSRGCRGQGQGASWGLGGSCCLLWRRLGDLGGL